MLESNEPFRSSEMAEHITTEQLTRVARANLTRYTAELSLQSLAVGVDNIHHDVFLSPKFVEVHAHVSI